MSTAIRRPHLLLPPVCEPRTQPDPREVVLRHPVTRSVLMPAAEEDWPVPPSDPTTRTRLPDPAPIAGAIVLAAVEALSGTRPVAQLARWLAPEVFDQLSARVAGAPPHRRRATVRSTRVYRVSPRAAEACVVVHDGARVRAAALRLQVHRRRWRATVLQIG
ncbi:Rv3235 family protein [Isoptericola sp. b441]|uniref:Rv3235 family protein n=1 Tax=Actinotalea lenta TaxID=3064654 RepID=A0ABT9DD90_9CELL|nr:Rv3235 family protein [Isoptericola sp. b441]MDO8108595.1 Rv3235 family protein [Isoptericola sp. b441]MDO8120005.1 Rv3235 family protein [Isoptericola sp. b490]